MNFRLSETPNSASMYTRPVRALTVLLLLLAVSGVSLVAWLILTFVLNIQSVE